MQASQRNRRGAVFGVRLTPEEREALEVLVARGEGPRALGPWLVWSALAGGGSTATGEVLPGPGSTATGEALPARPGTTQPGPPPHERVILDLCGGCGAWSAPYRAAGYDVRLVTLPGDDVRTYRPPPGVWGVLAAPPCEVWSRARVSPASDEETLRALEVVTACLRLVAETRPVWWALENPVGRLGRIMGRPTYTFEPHEHGDPWTKRTAVWGRFALPARGPFVRPIGGMDARTDAPPGASLAARRAVTPPGFARAFCEANP